MPRPPRPEVPGGFFHIGTRGVNRETVFYDPRGRRWFLELLRRATRRYGWSCFEYCLMGNHYHLLLQTPEPTLARGMQFLNGEYASFVNAVGGRDGHLFARRYWSELIESDAHLLETCRYIVLNPVRAGLCSLPEDWLWSGFAATAGIRRPHACLAVAPKLALFSRSREVAQQRYRSFVNDALPRQSSL